MNERKFIEKLADDRGRGNYHRETIETKGWAKHLVQYDVDPVKFSAAIEEDLKIDGKVNVSRLSRIFKHSYPTVGKWVNIYLKEKG